MEHIVLLLVMAFGPKGEILEFDGLQTTSMEICAKQAKLFLTEKATPQPGHKVAAYCVNPAKSFIHEEGYVTNPPELQAK